MKNTKIMFQILAIMTWVVALIVGIYCGGNFTERYSNFNFGLMLAIDFVGFVSGLIDWAIALHLENQEQIINKLNDVITEAKAIKNSNSSPEQSKATEIKSAIANEANIVFNEDKTKWRCPKCGGLNYRERYKCASCDFERK